MSNQEIGLRRARRTTWRAHAEAESAGDIDTLMATIASQPRWEVHPLLWWQGTEMVAAVYRFLMPEGERAVEEVIRATDDPVIARWGESHLLLQFTAAPDRYPCHRGMVLVVQFDGELVQGEYLYVTEPAMIDPLRSTMTRVAAAVPGVHWYGTADEPAAGLTFATRPGPDH
jgi:hypothetical protein